MKLKYQERESSRCNTIKHVDNTSCPGNELPQLYQAAQFCVLSTVVWTIFLWEAIKVGFVYDSDKLRYWQVVMTMMVENGKKFWRA